MYSNGRRIGVDSTLGQQNFWESNALMAAKFRGRGVPVDTKKCVLSTQHYDNVQWQVKTMTGTEYCSKSMVYTCYSICFCLEDLFSLQSLVSTCMYNMYYHIIIYIYHYYTIHTYPSFPSSDCDMKTYTSILWYESLVHLVLRAYIAMATGNSSSCSHSNS